MSWSSGRDLLRAAKMNSLKSRYERSGQHEMPDQGMVLFYHGEPLFSAPTPSRFLMSLKNNLDSEREAIERRGREAFNYLYRLQPEQLKERPRVSDHLRDCDFNSRAKSRLSTEVSRDDIMEAEYVDGGGGDCDGEGDGDGDGLEGTYRISDLGVGPEEKMMKEEEEEQEEITCQWILSQDDGDNWGDSLDGNAWSLDMGTVTDATGSTAISGGGSCAVKW